MIRNICWENTREALDDLQEFQVGFLHADAGLVFRAVRIADRDGDLLSFLKALGVDFVAERHGFRVVLVKSLPCTAKFQHGAEIKIHFFSLR